MIELGRAVRLQVQTQSLKRGERPRRVYDPSPLLEVARMRPILSAGNFLVRP